MQGFTKDCYHLVLHSDSLHLFVSLREALDSADGVVHQIKHLVVVSNQFLIHHVGGKPYYEVRVLNIALFDDLRQQLNKTLFHKDLVKVSFFSIDQQASHGFKQVIEDTLEVSFSTDLLQHLIWQFGYLNSHRLGSLGPTGQDPIEDLEEEPQIAR